MGNESRFCTYCGSELSFPEATVPSPSSPAATLASRFAALRAYPTYDELCAYEPPSTAAAVGLYSQAIGGVVFTVIALGMTFVFAAVGGPMAFAPLIMVLAGVFITATGLSAASRFSAAPLRTFPASVQGERVKVSGGGKNSSARTTYFATIQDEANRRAEYQAFETVASKVVPGDMGIAFLKGSYLIEFIVVPV